MRFPLLKLKKKGKIPHFPDNYKSLFSFCAAENTGSSRGNAVPGPPEELCLQGFLGPSRASARLALEWTVGFWAWSRNFFGESAYGILRFQKTEHM